MDEATWVNFLKEAGIKESATVEKYAAEFYRHQMTPKMLSKLNEFGDELKEFGVVIKGHIILIIENARTKNIEKKDESMVDKSMVGVASENEHLKNSSSENSPRKASSPSSPPKKRSKKEEFLNVVESCKGNVTMVVAQATSFITYLEQENEVLEIELLTYRLFLGSRQRLEEVCAKIIPPFIKANDLLNHKQKMVVSFELQILRVWQGL